MHQGIPRLPIALGHSRIEAIHTPVVQQDVDQVFPGRLLVRSTEGSPCLFREQDWYRGTGKRITEGSTFLEGLFKLGDGEARVDGEEGAFRIGSHQGSAAGTATLLKLVTKNLNEPRGIVATRNAD